MGRLVDSVMAALGLKPSDRVSFTTETLERPAQNKPENEQQTVKSVTLEKETITAGIEKEQNKGFGGIPLFPTWKPSPRQDVKESEKDEDIEAAVEEFKELVKSNVPEEKNEVDPTDCFGCKVVSGVVGTALSGYFLYIAKDNPNRLKGFRLGIWRTALTISAAGIVKLLIIINCPKLIPENSRKRRFQRACLS